MQNTMVVDGEGVRWLLVEKRMSRENKLVKKNNDFANSLHMNIDMSSY